jgi:iron complex outermembrane receptor protein
MERKQSRVGLKRTIPFSRVSFLLIALLGIILPLGTQSAGAQEFLDRKITLDIPQNTSLEDALISWGSAAGLSVLINTADVQHQSTKGIKGVVKAREALDAILSGSGLRYIAEGNRIIVMPISKSARSPSHASDTPAGARILWQGDYDIDKEKRLASSGGEAAKDDDLPQVLVSAEKREERLQDVPMAISAVSADDLVQNHEIYLRDYMATVPGVSIQESGADSQVVIRGLSSDVSPTVGITIDDVPVGLTNTQASFAGPGFVPQLDPSDLERVEVLKGPQGTLYGASSVGGLIRYVTAPPDLRSTFGRAQIDGSSIPSGGGTGFGVRGGANIPLIADTFGIRVSAFHREDPGFIDDPSHKMKDFNTAYVNGGRLDSLWQVTPDLSVRVAGLVDRIKSVVSLVDTAYSTGTVYYRPISGDLTYVDLLPGTGGYELEHQLYDATVKFHASWFDVTSITALGRESYETTSDWTPILGSSIPSTIPAIAPLCPCGATDPVTINSRKFTQEVQLASLPGKTFEWLVGAFYTNELTPTAGFNLQSAYLATGLPIPGGELYQQTFNQHYHEYAAFADFTYHFTSQFDVQAGARRSHNWQDIVLSDATGAYSGPGTAASSKDSSFTYLLSPRFRFSDSLMAYARVASGYQPGGPNALGPGLVAPLTYGPAKSANYELGVKGSFFEGRATVDTAVYDIQWFHVQLTSANTVTSYIYNGGGARSRGVETEIKLLPIDSLTIDASAAYSNAILTQSVIGNPGTAGDWLPYGSRWSGSLSAEQRFEISPSATGFVGATWAYVGKRYSDYNNNVTPVAVQYLWPGYSYANARMGIRWNGYTLTAFLNNIANSRGILSAIPQPNGFVQTAVITPRTVGLSVAKEFK